MKHEIRRKRGVAVLNGLAKIIPSKLARIRANQKTYRALALQYGELRSDADWKSYSVAGIENESEQVFGSVVHTIGEIDAPIDSMLLAGESGAAKPVYAAIAGIETDQITTAGLHDDADHLWNFEEAPPSIGPFHCIVSHAILEHLIDPYRHVKDLVGLLHPAGDLIIFTVTPGFPYHRHPIDCMRFLPDWFEIVAQRLTLEVKDRFFGDERVMYRLRRP